MGLIFGTSRFPAMPDDIEARDAKLAEHLRFLDDSITPGQLIAWEHLTIADISVACGLTMPCLIDPTFLKEFANVKSWYERVTTIFEFATVQKEFENFATQMKATTAEKKN